MTLIKPYGSWTSNITAEKLASKGVRYGHMCSDGDHVYWLECRATEQGRGVLMKADEHGHAVEVLAKNISIRSKVHEYGSGDYIVDEGVVYFSSAKNQCVYRFHEKSQQLQQLTTVSENEQRYADYAISADKKYLICVRETHFKNEVTNELVSISLTDLKQDHSEVKTIQSGFDFYSFPRLTKQGHRLCWTCWNQPNMPWDAAELWVADFHNDGTLDAAHKVAGGSTENKSTSITQSIYQPEWSGDGVLHYISDVSNWCNIYSCREGVLNALTPIDRDFGIPQWSLASSTYVITPENHIYAVYVQNGEQQLCHINADSGHIEPVDLPYKDFGEHLLLCGDYLYFKGASPECQESIVSFNVKSKSVKQISPSQSIILNNDELSIAETIQFKSKSERTCHAFYYQPINSHYSAPEQSEPPLIVMSHGGPTAMTTNSLDLNIQFWTNRGFAVVDVNYGGSTGFGKKYKDSLLGLWGVIDVEDCIAAADYLVEQKKADKNALLIRGGSAGGYTTLCALTFHSIFAAGMSRYGVADLESLASDSHKFEARYLDQVVGPYPEQKALYRARSPIHFAEQLSCPILLLQGEDDKVVPRNQAEMMVAALKKNKIPHAYKLYNGEGHGFRKAETIIDAFNSELSFYRQVLNIECEEVIPCINIECDG